MKVIMCMTFFDLTEHRWFLQKLNSIVKPLLNDEMIE